MVKQVAKEKQVCYCKIMPDGSLAEAANTIGTVVGGAGTVAAAAEGIAVGQDIYDQAQGRPGDRTWVGRLLHRGKGQSNNPAPKPHPFEPRRTPGPAFAAKGPPVTERAQEHMTDIRNLPAVDAAGRRRESGVRPSETVGFNEDVMDGLRGFAMSHVQKLINMERRPVTVNGQQKNAFEAMKAEQVTTDYGQAYQEDRYLLDLFTKVDPQTGERTLKEGNEIKTLFTTHPDMKKVLMIVAERWAIDALAAAGLRPEIIGAGHRSATTNLGRTIDLPVDQGVLNVVGRRIAHWLTTSSNAQGRGTPGRTGLQNLTLTGALASPGALAGALVGGPVGAAAGGLFTPAIAALVERATRNGVRIRLVEDSQLATRAQRPQELRRAREVLGVDPKDLSRSEGLDTAIQQAVQIIYLRADYLAGCGVPPEKMDALSDQWLNDPEMRYEETGEELRTEIGRRLDDQGGRGVGLNIDERRNRLRQAQGDALEARLDLISKKENRTPVVDRAGVLRDQVKAMGEGGTYRQERTREATEERDRLHAEKTDLEGSGTTLGSFRTKVVDIQRQAIALERTLSGIRAGATTYDTVEDAIDAMGAAISDPGAPTGTPPRPAPTITILLENGRTANIQNIATREDTANTNRGTAYNIISAMTPNPGESTAQFGARQTAARQVADTAYERAMVPINSDRQQLENAINRLRTMGDNLRTLDESALSSEEVTAGAQELGKFVSAERTIVTDWGIPQATIDAGEYGAILTEIHNAYTPATPTHGWPEAEDNQPEHRVMIKRAIVQARANVLARAGIPNPAIVELNYDSAITLGFSPEQLTVLSVDELERRSVDLNPAGTATPRGELKNAQMWAREQLRYIQESLRREGTIIQNLEQVKQREIDGVDFGAQTEIKEMVAKICDPSNPVRSRAIYAVPRRGEEANLVNINPAAIGLEGYIQAEVDLHLPRNILEILDVLTGYQSSANREGEFQKIRKHLINDPRFLEMLRESFREQIPPTAATDISSFSNELRDRIRNGTITEPDFTRGAHRMTDVLFNWARSI